MKANGRLLADTVQSSAPAPCPADECGKDQSLDPKSEQERCPDPLAPGFKNISPMLCASGVIVILRKSQFLRGGKMNDLHIRPAIVSEQKILEELQMRAALSNPADREAMLAHPDAIELPLDQIEAGRVFVLERNGVIVGFSAILPRDDGGTELDGLFVEPVFWRNGFGRLLVEHCVQVSRGQGVSALHVVGNPHAEKFYLACGFKSVGLAKTRFGEGLLLKRLL